MRTFSVSVRQQVMDEKNMVKSKRFKVLVKAGDPSWAIHDASVWLAEVTEKGSDCEVLTCAGSSLVEVVIDTDAQEPKYYETTVEYRSVDPTKKGRRTTLVAKSDTVSSAVRLVEEYFSTVEGVKIVACKESTHEELIGF